MPQTHFNIFRVLADLSHTASKCILIWAIHWNKSAEGVSLLTQILYVAVFINRYLDLFWVSPQKSRWNFILKVFYILSSVYIIVIMTRVYARTREREKAWRLGAYVTAGSIALTPVVSFSYFKGKFLALKEMPWTFSIILESVCVLPQLLLLRQTTIPTVIDSFYLLALGSYRALYIANWIYRASTGGKPNLIPVVFGVIQTAFYLDFAWVYWTRQRVKLRGGGIVDEADLRKGYLVNRFIGHSQTNEEDPGSETGLPNGQSNSEAPTPGSNRWGQRGVSVSADDTLNEHYTGRGVSKGAKTTDSESQRMLDEDDGLFSDDGDDDALVLDESGERVLNSDAQWREDSSPGK